MAQPRYQVIERIDAGGMAEVFKAKEDPWSGSPVPEDKRRDALKAPVKKEGLNTNQRPTEQVKEKEQQERQQKEKDILDDLNSD